MLNDHKQNGLHSLKENMLFRSRPRSLQLTAAPQTKSCSFLKSVSLTAVNLTRLLILLRKFSIRVVNKSVKSVNGSLELESMVQEL
jgi:hypothetical protein